MININLSEGLIYCNTCGKLLGSCNGILGDSFALLVNVRKKLFSTVYLTTDGRNYVNQISSTELPVQFYGNNALATDNNNNDLGSMNNNNVIPGNNDGEISPSDVSMRTEHSNMVVPDSDSNNSTDEMNGMSNLERTIDSVATGGNIEQLSASNTVTQNNPIDYSSDHRRCMHQIAYMLSNRMNSLK